MPSFSENSKIKLNSCHPSLQKIANEAIKQIDFTILCGHRNKIDQLIAFQEGKSKVQWPDSKHNKVPSLAFDIAPYVNGKISWVKEHHIFLLIA